MTTLPESSTHTFGRKSEYLSEISFTDVEGPTANSPVLPKRQNPGTLDRKARNLEDSNTSPSLLDTVVHTSMP
jgi:hypothetical protein